MDFQISALSEATFSHLYGAPTETLARYGARRVVADASPGYPCRVSLRDAQIGETLLLLNYTHQDEDTPYRASHAIFIIEHAKQATPDRNEVPQFLRSRLLSVRAFNANHDLVAADVSEGEQLEHLIEQFAANLNVAYMHVHNAKPGCFAAKINVLPGAKPAT